MYEQKDPRRQILVQFLIQIKFYLPEIFKTNVKNSFLVKKIVFSCCEFTKEVIFSQKADVKCSCKKLSGIQITNFKSFLYKNTNETWL